MIFLLLGRNIFHSYGRIIGRIVRNHCEGVSKHLSFLLKAYMFFEKNGKSYIIILFNIMLIIIFSLRKRIPEKSLYVGRQHACFKFKISVADTKIYCKT